MATDDTNNREENWTSADERLEREIQSRYYRRDGTRYTGPHPLVQWAKDMQNHEYKVVRQTHLWWGGLVSTVWLGLDHTLFDSGDRRPLIFETMVFGVSDPGNDMDMDRYATEAEAIEGHWKMVRRWQFPIGRLWYAVMYRLKGVRRWLCKRG